jgi:Domain of unknown function (DUF4748)
VAGGGAYYFAKKSIDADKRSKYETLRQKKLRNAEIEERERVKQLQAEQQRSTHSKANYKGQDYAGSPSDEASADPAPTGHRENGTPRSKYEPTQPYRSPRGDRFT